ncbi:MAG: SDR family NAD(P)-dependent oxidoreductase [Hyphomicrobiaceae bacterium]|nr:SDR family NAD(P)-dependent oxidoreductase [Hyphomicrobiaceae bacterium]
MAKPLPWSTVWITGAGTGIGREVALRLARRGATVAVSARTLSDLESLAREAPGIHPYPLDVADAAATKATATSIEEAHGPIDLVILNAAIWRRMFLHELDVAKVAKAMNINFMGVVHGIDAVLPAMLARRAGHIAIVGSVAGYRGLPGSAAYSPGKAALMNLAEVMRLELEGKGITTTIISPGFVDTPMTRVNDFPMPFIMPAGAAAERIVRGLEQRKYEIAFPWQLAYALWLGKVLRNEGYFRYARWFLLPRDDGRSKG